MNQIEDVLRQIPTPEVPVAADVRRGQRGLRRRRLARTGVGIAAAAVVGAGGWMLAGTGESPGEPPVADPTGSTESTAAWPLTWESLQPSYDSPFLPGDDPLLLPLDANTVPALEVLVPLLDPAGDHVRPPATSASPKIRDGRPVQVTIYLGWQEGGRATDVEIRLAADQAAAQWECASECEERDVEGEPLLTGVTDGGSRVWGMRQDDGEWVTVFGEAGDPLSQDQVLAVLTSDIDLPSSDLTPTPPQPAVSYAVMRAIGEDVLVRGDRRVVTEVDRANGNLGGRLIIGGDDVAWIGWHGTPVAEVEDPVSEERCDAALYTLCDARDVDGHTVVVAYDDRYPDDDGDGRVHISYAGPVMHTAVWTSFEGEIGSERPVVPYEDIYRILLDERWQEQK